MGCCWEKSIMRRASILPILLTATVLSHASASNGQVPTDTRLVEAVRTLREARTIAMDLPRSEGSGSSQNNALIRIACALAEAGDLDGALETAATFPQGTMRDFVRIQIAQIRAEKGDPEGVRVAAGTIRDSKRFVVVAQVRLHIARGEMAEAAQAARNLRDREERRQALAEVQAGHLAAGKPADALELEPPVTGDLAQVDSFLTISRTARKKGDQSTGARALSLALASARAIKGDERSLALMEIAVEQARSGAFDDALALAEDVKDIEPRAVRSGNLLMISNGETGLRMRTLCQIALEQARARRFDAAYQIAERVQDVPEKTIRKNNIISVSKPLTGMRTVLLRQILEEQTLAGDLEEARRRLASLPGKTKDEIQERTLALNALGAALFRAGRRDEAVNAFEEAVRLAPSFSEIVRTAQARYAAGDQDGGRATFEQARIRIRAAGDKERVAGLRELAEAQAACGEKSGATASYRQAIDEALRLPGDAWEIGALVRSVGDNADPGAALPLADRVSDTDTKMGLLETLAQRQTEKGDSSVALGWGQARTNRTEKVFLLLGVAQGRIAQALPPPPPDKSGYWDWQPH